MISTGEPVITLAYQGVENCHVNENARQAQAKASTTAAIRTGCSGLRYLRTRTLLQTMVKAMRVPIEIMSARSLRSKRNAMVPATSPVMRVP